MVRPCQTSLRAVWFGRPTNLLVKRCSVKSGNKELVKTKITTYFVTHLGIAAAQNSLMTYRRLDWVPPPGSIKLNHNTQCEIVETTPEISLWELLYSTKATQLRGSSHCRICLEPCETVSHAQWEKILLEFESLCIYEHKNKIDFEKILEDKALLCQFILDPTSLNLPKRVSMNDPLLPNFFKMSGDSYYLMEKIRTKLLSEMFDNL